MRTTETRRIGRWLAGAAVTVVVATLVLGAAAPASAAPTAAAKVTPAAAGDGSDCYAVADAPWHSTVTNRVYFSGHITCPQSFPSLINMYTLWYWGPASQQYYQGQNFVKCYESTYCYTGAGSYATYAGNYLYCTVIQGSVWIPYGRNVTSVKTCAWL